MGAAEGGCCTPGALSLVLFKESVPDPERKTACYRIPRPSNHTAGYRIPQGRTDMRFRATQLGRRLQRGHTLQRRCYVAAHSTQGTSRTPSPTKRLRGTADATTTTRQQAAADPFHPISLLLPKETGWSPKGKALWCVSNVPTVLPNVSVTRTWSSRSQRVLVHRRPRTRFAYR